MGVRKQIIAMEKKIKEIIFRKGTVLCIVSPQFFKNNLIKLFLPLPIDIIGYTVAVVYGDYMGYTVCSYVLDNFSSKQQ